MQDITREDLECFKDPAWRLRNLYFITNKAKKKVLFDPNRIQSYIDENLGRYNAVLKARQVGISTYWLLKYLDIACFTPNVTIAILSHEWESLRKLFKIIRYAHRSMPEQVQPVLDKGGGSQYRLYFPEINSEIYCTLEAVSDAVSHLHVSEFALMNSPDRVLTSMDSVPVETGRISIETTPRGFNHFYDFWVAQTGYKKFFFPWYMHDEYQIPTEPLRRTLEEQELVKKAFELFNITITDEQLAFRRAKIANKRDKNSFLQEYPEDDQTCFVTSGQNPFDQILLSKLMLELKKPIQVDERLGLEIYKPFNKENSYVLGADVSEGVGLDWSVCTVYEVANMEQVAQIRGQWKPSDFAHNILELAKIYKHKGEIEPLLAVERNNHGHAVLQELNEHIGYRHLFKHKDGRLGWLSDRISRPLMLDTFIQGVEASQVKLNSRDTLQECLTLTDHNGKIQHSDGKHDDTVIASAIAVQMCIKQSKLSIYDNIASKIKM